MNTFRLHPGISPLLISIPHAGTLLPPEIEARLSEAGQARGDTDWHVDRLYDFASDLGASVLVAGYSRYVIDLNRPADGAPLYPGADETELCPTTSFGGEPLYRDGQGIEPGEVEVRLDTYWRPYHRALAGELQRIKKAHGQAVLWDAHSICSRVPRFFGGRLPDYNFGTGGGNTADPALARELISQAQALGLDAVCDQRFKGGYITRNYGKPGDGVQAVQLELTWRNYMQESAPYDFDAELAAPTQAALEALLVLARDFRPA